MTQRNQFAAIFFSLINELTIGAEFTFALLKEQCINHHLDYPDTAIRKFLKILRNKKIISSRRAPGLKSHIHKKEYDISWGQFDTFLHEHYTAHYNAYQKPIREAKKVAKIIKKKAGVIQNTPVENPDGLVGIKRSDLEKIKQTVLEQDIAIIKYAEEESAWRQVEKQLRSQINLLTQENSALKKGLAEKIDELSELTRELRRREAVAKQVPLTPADISFFERRGRA